MLRIAAGNTSIYHSISVYAFRKHLIDPHLHLLHGRVLFRAIKPISSPPRLGEDAIALLRELGYDQDKFDELLKSGTVRAGTD